MMELSKKDLKKISREFRSVSSRLIQSSYEDIFPILNIFINTIEKQEIVYEYIKNCTNDGYDVKKAFEDAYGDWDNIFLLGNTVEEEVYTIYNILKYILDNNVDITMITMGYSRSKYYQEKVKAFHDRVTLVLVNHIDNYLMNIAIDMGYDEEVKHMITVNGTQVNISNGNSTLNAVQNNNNNESSELIKIIDAIKGSIDKDIPEDEKEIILENVETIQEQLESEKPKKGLIKTCIAGLNTTIMALPHAIQLSENVNKFIEYAKEFIK